MVDIYIGKFHCNESLVLPALFGQVYDPILRKFDVIII